MKTSNFQIAIALIIRDNPLVGMERVTENRFAFVFEDTERLEETIEDFHQNKVETSVQHFFYLVARLKKAIDNEKTRKIAMV